MTHPMYRLLYDLKVLTSFTIRIAGIGVSRALWFTLQLAPAPAWARYAPFYGIGGHGGAPYRIDCGESAVLVASLDDRVWSSIGLSVSA